MLPREYLFICILVMLLLLGIHLLGMGLVSSDRLAAASSQQQQSQSFDPHQHYTPPIVAYKNTNINNKNTNYQPPSNIISNINNNYYEPKRSAFIEPLETQFNNKQNGPPPLSSFNSINQQLPNNLILPLPEARGNPRPVAPPPMSQGPSQPVNGYQQVPACARPAPLIEIGGFSNVTGAPAGGQQVSSVPGPILFCNEDPEYPTSEIMRALEEFGEQRSIEQLLPQALVQLLQMRQQGQPPTPEAQVQRQLALDSLQPSISLLKDGPMGPGAGLFPSASYESMCRSSVYMAQPRRAKNLLGIWKIVINLPGHKYRGVAVNQMIRIEECARPMAECNAPPPFPVPNGGMNGGQRALQPVPLARSRCLQQYESQHLVAWSPNQGLHIDIFRVPTACSCHIRRM